VNEKVRIALKDTTYRFQCLGCYQPFTSFTPFSAAFARHVTDCVPCPFYPEDIDDEEGVVLSWRDRFLFV